MNAEAQRIQPAPIRKTIRVKASQERAFDVFFGSMGTWWLKTHSLLKSPQRDVIVEAGDGGRWYEVGDDGSEQTIGKVLSWNPPSHALLAWQVNADWRYDPDFETIVEVRFTPDSDHTIVDFEHRNLERFGERAEAMRGDYESGMEGGWGKLLASYQAALDNAADA